MSSNNEGDLRGQLWPVKEPNNSNVAGCADGNKCYSYGQTSGARTCSRNGWRSNPRQWFIDILKKAANRLQRLGNLLKIYGRRRRRDVTYGKTMPNNDTVSISPYCGVNSSLTDTPTNVTSGVNSSLTGTPTNVTNHLANYFLSLSESSDPKEVECMTLSLFNFVALVEEGSATLPISQETSLLNVTNAANDWLTVLIDELNGYSTTTTTETSTTTPVQTMFTPVPTTANQPPPTTNLEPTLTNTTKATPAPEPVRPDNGRNFLMIQIIQRVVLP
ncbi:uncharacterized protein [Palaemon carinicauda]|uniref:uncharacterized protein n=1 Tax=Palaemon carinicauda TaxID=392227 RepID=UPI0035B696E3